MNHVKQGMKDCDHFFQSQGFAGISRSITGEDAVKLFWPNTTEARMEISRPMDKDRKHWIDGFNLRLKQRKEMQK